MSDKKKKKYKNAPPKSAAAKFFTSFFLTLTILLSLLGFCAAYANSENLGWGRDCTVFKVINDGDNLGVTVMNSSYFLDKNVYNTSENILNKTKLFCRYLEPAPVRLLSRAVLKGTEYGFDYLKDYLPS